MLQETSKRLTSAYNGTTPQSARVKGKARHLLISNWKGLISKTTATACLKTRMDGSPEIAHRTRPHLGLLARLFLFQTRHTIAGKMRDVI